MTDLSDKIALITGGSRGIGAATANIMADAGATVVIGYNSKQQQAEDIVQEITRRGGSATLVNLKLADESSIRSSVAFVAQHFGKIDILVNNGGVSFATPIETISAKEFDDIFRVNVLGPTLLIQAALPYFPEAGGAIVNVTSTAAIAPGPAASIYAASKAALAAMTQALAKELGPRNIRVNSVAPGATETDLLAGASEELRRAVVSGTPQGRPAHPEEIATIIAFLASQGAAWINGRQIIADGGRIG